MTGKFFISISFLIIYIFTGDFFPTLVRNQAYGAASFSGRIGGIVTPYFLYLGRYTPILDLTYHTYFSDNNLAVLAKRVWFSKNYYDKSF